MGARRTRQLPVSHPDPGRIRPGSTTPTADPTAIVVAPDVRLYDAGLRLYADRLDKNWSVTDCISFLAMRERRIVEALTTDHHFEQAGFVALLKQPA